MANNPILFNAALSGAFAGINTSRSLASVVGADYTTQRNSAFAFATLLDGQIAAAGTFDQQDANVLGFLVQQVVSGKGESAANLATINAIIAAWTFALAVLDPAGASPTNPVYVENYLAAAGGDLRGAMIAAQAANLVDGTTFVLPAGTFTWVPGTTFQPRNITNWSCYGCTVRLDVAGIATGQQFIFLRSDSGVGTSGRNINVSGLRADILNVLTSYFSAAVQIEAASNCTIKDCDFRTTFTGGVTTGRIRWGANLLGGDQSLDPTQGRNNLFQNIRLTFAQVQGCGAGRSCDGVTFDTILSDDSNDLAVSCVSGGAAFSLQNVTIRNIISRNAGGSGVVLAGTDGAGIGIGAGIVRNLLIDGVWLDGERSTPDLDFPFITSVVVYGGLVTENVVITNVGTKLAPNASLQARSVQIVSQDDEVSWHGLGLSNLELGIVTTNDPLEALLILGRNITGAQINNVNVRGSRGVRIVDVDLLTLSNITTEDGTLVFIAASRDLTNGISLSNVNVTRSSGFQICISFTSTTNRSYGKVLINNAVLNGLGNPIGVILGAGTAQLWLSNIENTSGNNPDAPTLASIVRVKNVRGFIVPVTVSVVVPAVAAASVGYVDVSMAGTRLADLAVGENVVAQPTADLVAAGVGGGYANARVSAVGTVRMAFIGALAGGAVDFDFDRAA